MSGAITTPHRGYAALPVPFGCFGLAMSSEIAAGDVGTMRYSGTKVVMWRGEVVGNDLCSPFHHWTFNREASPTLPIQARSRPS